MTCFLWSNRLVGPASGANAKVFLTCSSLVLCSRLGFKENLSLLDILKWKHGDSQGLGWFGQVLELRPLRHAKAAGTSPAQRASRRPMPRIPAMNRLPDFFRCLMTAPELVILLICFCVFSESPLLSTKARN